MINNPIVSICCVTYNHEPFIRQCLDGFLMQKTEFSFEIIIHDDASTDKTTQIVKQYANKYPDLIKPIFQNENQYSKYMGGMYVRFVYPIARGKYIAICDGDDYWTDPHKLQKQVDFLEAHDNYILCAGRSLKQNGDNFFDFRSSKTGIITFRDIAYDNILVSNTVIFRNIFRNNESNKISDYLILALNGDIVLFLALLTKGNGYIVQDHVGIYRQHDGGMISKKPDKEKIFRALQSRKIFIRYLKDMEADDQYIKDVEYGCVNFFEWYLQNNMLTEEFIELVSNPVLIKTINNLTINYKNRINELNHNMSLLEKAQQSGTASSVECLVAERDAALRAIEAIKQSKSWRLTVPLRLLKSIIKSSPVRAFRALARNKMLTGEKVIKK